MLYIHVDASYINVYLATYVKYTSIHDACVVGLCTNGSYSLRRLTHLIQREMKRK